MPWPHPGYTHARTVCTHSHKCPHTLTHTRTQTHADLDAREKDLMVREANLKKVRTLAASARCNYAFHLSAIMHAVRYSSILQVMHCALVCVHP